MGLFKHSGRTGTGDNLHTPGMTAEDFIKALKKNPNADMTASLTALGSERPGVAGEFLVLSLDGLKGGKIQNDNVAYLCLALIISDPQIPAEEREKHVHAVLPRVVAMFTDRSIDDDQMLLLAAMFEQAGHPLPEGLLQQSIRDMSGTLKRQVEKNKRILSEEPESITTFLDNQDLYSFLDDCKPSIADINEVLSPLLEIAEEYPAATVMAATCVALLAEHPNAGADAIPKSCDRIRSLQTPRALWCLEALANWPGLGAVRLSAKHAADELRQAGVTAEPPALKGEFSKAKVSMTDDSGSRNLIVFWRRSKRELDAVSIMLNDTAGVKGTMFVFGEGKEFAKALADGPGGDVVWVDVSREMARALLADALALHLENGTAPPGILFAVLAYFGDTPLKPEQREPNLDAYNLAAITPTRALAGPETVNLTESPLLLPLAPMPEAGYVFCQGCKVEPGETLSEDDRQRFIKEIIEPERDHLLHRIAVNLEVEALAGRAKRRENRQVAELLHGLRNNVTPFAEHPFIQALAIDASDMILEDIENGLTTRAAAFDHAMSEPPEEFAEMLQGIMNDPEMAGIPPEELRSLFSDMFDPDDDASPSRDKVSGSKKGKAAGKKGKGKKR